MTQTATWCGRKRSAVRARMVFLTWLWTQAGMRLLLVISDAVMLDTNALSAVQFSQAEVILIFLLPSSTTVACSCGLNRAVDRSMITATAWWWTVTTTSL